MCTPFWQSLNMSVGWGAVEHIKFLSIYNTIAKSAQDENELGWEREIELVRMVMYHG